VTTILLIGTTGQLGWELRRALPSLGRVVAVDRTQMDLASPDSIRKWIRDVHPDIILNAAGYTAVDRAEAEPELAMQVNARAPEVMADEAKRIDALFVHYSTDYVFDGKSAEPYCEKDEPNPVNVYGKSKLEGERAIAASDCTNIILRASWIYSGRGTNFVLTMLRLARERQVISVVDDQIGSPSWSRALAAATVALLKQPARAKEAPGIYHLSAQGYTTRFAFALRIFKLAEEISRNATYSPALRPISSKEYPLPARRPLNAATSKQKLRSVFDIEMTTWEEQLHTFMYNFFGTDHAKSVLAANVVTAAKTIEGAGK
jgi:dTDP-4-dehydrorhamnose reductase